MRRMAIVNNNVLENIALWDGLAEWYPNCEMVIDITEWSEFVDIGYEYDPENDSFTPPVND